MHWHDNSAPGDWWSRSMAASPAADWCCRSTPNSARSPLISYRWNRRYAPTSVRRAITTTELRWQCT